MGINNYMAGSGRLLKENDTTVKAVKGQNLFQMH